MSNPTKVTKTYFLVSNEDGLYEKGYYKTTQPDGSQKVLENPTKDYPNGQDENGNTVPKQPCRWTFRFPEQFIHSVNPRSIEVHKVTVATNTTGSTNSSITNDILMHASFIKRDPYLDQTVMIANEIRTKFKKYAYTSAEQTFDVWFTSFAVKNWFAEYGKTKFIIEMMLIY